MQTNITQTGNLSNTKQETKGNSIFQKKNLDRAAKVGSSFLNAGMYMAEGRNFKSDRYDRNNRTNNYMKNKQELNNTAKMEMDKHEN